MYITILPLVYVDLYTIFLLANWTVMLMEKLGLKNTFWALPIIPGVIVDGALSLNNPYTTH